MATSKDYEGKTIVSAPTSSLCSMCDDDIPIVHCELCESNMCERCERGHSRNKYTKDHETLAVKLSVPSPPQKVNLQTVKCADHSLTTANLGCKECNVFLCEECRTKHPGHNVQYMTENTEFINTICLKQKSDAMKLIDHFQAQRRVAEGYKECCRTGINLARQIECDIQNKIKVEIHCLQTVLERGQKQQEKLLLNEEYGLVPLLRELYNYVGTLTGRLQEGGNDAKLDVISRFNVFLTKAMTIKTRIPTSSDIPCVDTLLPKLKDTKKICDNIAQQFSLNLQIIEQRTSLEVPLDYCELYQLEKLNVPTGQYCISQPKRYENEEKILQDIVLFKKFDNRLFTYNQVTGIIHERQVDFNIDTLIDVGKNGHRLILESKTKEVVEVDCAFRRVWSKSTTYSDSKQVVASTIASPGSSEVVLCNVLQDGSAKVYIYTKWRKVQEHVLNICFRPTIFQINYSANLTSEKAIYFFPWPPSDDTLNVKSYDMSPIIEGVITSMFEDRYGNSLIGDSQGNVHLFDSSWNHKVILAVKDSICGIRPINGGRMLITTAKGAFVYG